MSDRTRRMLNLALTQKQSPSSSYYEEISECDASSDHSEYVPTSTSSDSTSYNDNVYDFTDDELNLEKQDRNKLIKVYDFTDDEFNLDKPENNKLNKIEYATQYTTSKKQIGERYVDIPSDQCLPFEFNNDFKDENLFNDDIIARLRNYFGITSHKSKPGKVKKYKDSDVYASPYLKANSYKKTMCKFCDAEIVSRHFARHLERQHKNERQVRELLMMKSGSKEKKQYLQLIRNDGNLDDAIRGKIIPKKRGKNIEINANEYVICIHCKGFYKRLSLSRHVKKCFANNQNLNDVTNTRPLAESLTFAACQKKYGEILNKLNVKTEIFAKMQPDGITKVATEDLLIIYYGEDLLKKTKMKRSFYHISNKLRECARLLIEMKKIDSYDDMLAVLKPENFDKVIEGVKRVSNYNDTTRSFGAASLALHFRTTLIALCSLASKLILRQKIPHLLRKSEESLTVIERFKNLIESQWAVEIGSLALKDLNEKSAIKPKFLPVTEDIVKLAKLVEEKADEAFKKLTFSKDINAYRILAETILVFTILHNRRRVGDVHYLEWKSCKEQLQVNNTVLQTELAASLSNSEKVLTQNYKRITSIGKGSRPVVILIPKRMQKYYIKLCNLRYENWFPPENTYLFTYPRSTHWIDGCSAIRKYATMSEAKYPELLTSSRLRKHIATVTQLLSLRENEIDQLAKFMGHTKKTHETFYKLPQDVYQIAKVSKILQIMEKGNAAQFKNKSLEEIDVDMENIELDNNDQEGTAFKFVGQCQIDNNDHAENMDTESPVDNNIQLEKSDLTSSDFNYSNQDKDKVIPDSIVSESIILEKVISNSNNANKKNAVIRGYKQKRDSRQKWTDTQKKLIRISFKDAISRKKAPKKGECESFIKKYQNMFAEVGWLKVKTFVFNEYTHRS